MIRLNRAVFIISLALISLVLSLVLVNLLIPYVCKNCQPGFIEQAVWDGKFDMRYVYWGNSYCGNDCDNSLDEVVTSKPVKYGESYGSCERILFLGDSFTDSPWDGQGKSYAEHFASNLSNYNQQCYELVRVATSGTGNDQQFARFTDIVQVVQPKLVVWQFYWNDFYDNVEKPLYEFSGKGFYRTISFQSAYFWTGWIFENIPFIHNTNLGHFLLYFGELKKDLKVDWIAIENDPKLLFEFNTKKITFFLNEMKWLGEKYHFRFITTASPLECEFLYPDNCENLVTANAQVPLDIFAEVQHQLVQVLQNNSSYTSMYADNDYLLEKDILGASDFWWQENEVGARHLGATGQEKAGNILFINFIQNEN